MKAKEVKPKMLGGKEGKSCTPQKLRLTVYPAKKKSTRVKPRKLGIAIDGRWRTVCLAAGPGTFQERSEISVVGMEFIGFPNKPCSTTALSRLINKNFSHGSVGPSMCTYSVEKWYIPV
jgi:hypothetical protein